MCDSKTDFKSSFLSELFWATIICFKSLQAPALYAYYV